ncbi:MAG: hypothetical protein PXX83_05960 [Candidatus Nitrosotalea sp.]|nr:hypothetical protein [Candidatus Nitrosotalea sp.]
MSNKIALLLFTTSVLLTSVIAVFVPQANALTPSTRFDTISTASFGHSVVCGDHVCAPGEHTAWIDAMWASQKVSYGKIGSFPYGEDVMAALAGSAAFHGNNTMNSQMGNNMTSSMSMPSK